MTSRTTYLLAAALGYLGLASLYPVLSGQALAIASACIGLSFLSWIATVYLSTGKAAPQKRGSPPSTSIPRFLERHYFIGGPSSVPVNKYEQDLWLLLRTSYLRSEWTNICRDVVRSERNYLTALRHSSPQEQERARCIYGSTRMKQDELAQKLWPANFALFTETSEYFGVKPTQNA